MPVIMIVGTALLIMVSMAAVGVGAVGIPLTDVLDTVAARLTNRPATGPYAYIVAELRIPRILQAVVVGAGLAAGGCVVQALVRNPLADPYLLGLSSGASLGAVLILTTIGVTVVGQLSLPIAAFAGAAATGVLVFALAMRHGRLLPGRMIMIGVAAGSLLSGLTSYLVLRGNSADAARQVMFWLLGSLAGAQWQLLGISAAIVGPLLIGIAVLAGRLNVLALGDDAAAGLGISAATARMIFFILSALLIGTVVSVSGPIGFVGLVVPNLARILVGADHRRSVPVCLLLGAFLVLAADTAARTLLAPIEIPIGIMTALVGAPAFIIAVRRSGVGQVEL